MRKPEVDQWKSSFAEMLFPRDLIDLRSREAFDLKFQNIPRRLFKFYRFGENQFGMENLKNSQVWLSFPEKFNDPYDCALTYSRTRVLTRLMRENVETELASLKIYGMNFSFSEIQRIKNAEDIVGKFAEIALQKSPKLDGTSALKVAAEFRSAVERHFSAQPNALLEETRRGTILASFTERNDSILMWSHYAASHTGFCVEYDFPSLGKDTGTNEFLFPVFYQENLTDITDYFYVKDLGDFNSTALVLPAITKSTEWSYEREWRLLVPFRLAQEEMTWPMPKPTAIYLGSRISTKDWAEIFETGKNMSIPMFGSRMKAKEFGIEFFELIDFSLT